MLAIENPEYRRKPYLGAYGIHLTPAESEQGYPMARIYLAGYSNTELAREYKDMLRASFGRLFGHNARAAFNLVVDELLIRGVKEIPNLFGPLEVSHWKVP